jgi:hypothetical protein
VNDFVFSIALAGLLTHELDAVHKREWRLLFVLRHLPEPQARDAFILVHVPAVALLLWLAAHPDHGIRQATVVVLDLFMVVHAGLHWRLSNHPKYEFNNPISNILIYAPAVIALGHLAVQINA